jgi:ATP-dependent Clp protease adaptor protein ClpS
MIVGCGWTGATDRADGHTVRERDPRAANVATLVGGDVGASLLDTGWAPSMGSNDTVITPHRVTEMKVERPRLHKVILVNDDFTPREFVVTVLRAEFGLATEQAHRVMITAHERGVCVVAVFPKDVAETKATTATEIGRRKGYPLLFTTEPEE